MENLKSSIGANPKSMSILEQEMEDVYIQLSRIESTLKACFESFTKFDLVANKLNPEDYFKNQPTPENEGRCIDKGKAPYPYVKSGHIARLSELSQYAKSLEEMVSVLNEGNIIPVTTFFERNI